MLVLSRSRNEIVLIGDDVKITMLGVRCGEEYIHDAQVRIGFEAPKEVTIMRAEVAARREFTGGPSTPKKPRPKIVGHTTTVNDASVFLRIQSQTDKSVHHNRNSTPREDSCSQLQSYRLNGPAENEADDGSPAVIELQCRREDTILIGESLTLVIVGVNRFVKTGTS